MSSSVKHEARVCVCVCVCVSVHVHVDAHVCVSAHQGKDASMLKL